MRRVLILCNSSGGLYDFRNDLPLRLLSRGDEVIVSVPDDVRAGELAGEGCTVIHTDIDRRGTNPLRDLSLIRAYDRLMVTYRPDIILTYTIKPNVYGGWCAARRHIPYIATVTGLGSAFRREGMVRRLIVTMYRMGLKKASCVFFQNEANRDIFGEYGILRGGIRNRVVSGSGVDLEHHTPAPYPGHSDDIVRFLYVGRLMREKGTMEYIAAARRLHELYGDRVSVCAIGYSDEDMGGEPERAVSEGCLRLIPFDKEIRPYYHEADVVVMPSYHEGMSNVLMEAAATARPVIGSDIPGCRELIEDGVTGLLCKPGDSESLIRAMCRMMDMSADSRRLMGEAGRARMERLFDRRAVIDAYMDELARLC